MTLLNDAALLEPERLVFPPGWVGHIPFASWITALLKPALLVELGTHSGNSYSAFCQAIARERLPTIAFAVDTWTGDEHAGSYDDSVFLDLLAYHDPRYGGFSTLLRTSFDEAVQRFADGSIDLLHIDGLHTYDAVKHDFETWLPKLSERAVVLFHDTCVHSPTFGVHRLWEELTQEYPGFNFKHSHGLGVLLVGAKREPELLALAQGTDPAETWRLACDYFRTLGGSVQRRARIESLESEVAERDARLGGQQQSIAAQAEEMAQLRRAMAQHEQHIPAIEAALAARDAQLEGMGEEATQLRTALVQCEQRIPEFEAALATRDAQLAVMGEEATQLRIALVQYEERFSALESAAAARDAELAGMNEAIIERTNLVAGLQQSLAEQDQQLSELRTWLAEQEAHAAGLVESIAVRDDEVARLAEAVSHRDGLINSGAENAALLQAQAESLEAVISTRQQQLAALELALAAANAKAAELEAVRDGQSALIEDMQAKYVVSEADLLRYQSHWVFKLLRHPQRTIVSTTNQGKA